MTSRRCWRPRKAILNKYIDLEKEIRGLFKAFGIKLPLHISRLRFDETVRPIIAADEALTFALRPMLDVRGRFYDTYRLMEQRVIGISRDDAVCKLLMTAPGIGACHRAVAQSDRRRSDTVQFFPAGRRALRTDAQALPVRGDGQSRPDIEGR